MIEAGRGELFTDYVSDGVWSGQRCFVIGGGPSLRAFNWDLLRGELVIAVNRAGEFCDPAIIFSLDTRFWEHTANCTIAGKPGKERLENFGGYCLWEDTGGNACKRSFGNYVMRLPKTKIEKGNAMPRTMKDGVGHGFNSGFGAVSLALCLGADPIYLLGFDMKGQNGVVSHFHSGYPRKWRQNGKVYSTFIASFNKVAEDCLSRAKIINLNPDSAMECFPRMTWDEAGIETKKRPVVVAYYTKGTGYEKESVTLHRSLHLFGLEHEILGVRNLGSWQKNTQFKSRFIKVMLEKYHGRPVVYIDVDAEIKKYPILWDQWSSGNQPPDIGVYYRDFGDKTGNRKELLSGTVYFGNSNEKSLELVNQWIDINEKHPKTWDQKTLAIAIQGWDGTVKFMPAEYCCIFDLMQNKKWENVENPVVIHYQASRRLKKQVESCEPESMEEYEERKLREHVRLTDTDQIVLNEMLSKTSIDVHDRQKTVKRVIKRLKSPVKPVKMEVTVQDQEKRVPTKEDIKKRRLQNVEPCDWGLE